MLKKNLIPFVLVVLPVLFFWDLAFLRRTIFVGDTWMYYYPVKYYSFHLLKQGIFPLWTPNLFCGFPLFAEAQGGILYPLNTLFYTFLPTWVALNWTIVVRHIMAALFLYLYLKEITGNRLAACLGGLVFSFSGYMIAQMRHENVEDALIWLPAVLFCLERWNRIRVVRFLFLAGLGLVCSFLAGYFFVAFLVMLVSTVYTLFIPEWQGWTGLMHRIKMLVLVCSLGIAGAAVQILPGYELSQYTSRAEGVSYAFSTQVSLSPFHLITLLVPRFFGHPEADDFWGLWHGNAIDLVMYLGILPLLFGVVAVWLRRDRYLWFWLGLAGFALLAALGPFTPLWSLLNRLPIFAMMRVPARFLGLFTVAGSVLAGLGLATLLTGAFSEGFPVRWRRCRRWLLGGVVGFILLAGIGHLALGRLRDPVIAFGQWFVERFVYERSVHEHSLEHYFARIEQYYDRVTHIVRLDHPYLFVPIILLLLSMALLWWFKPERANRSLFGVMVVLLSVGDLYYFGYRYNPPVDPVLFMSKQYYVAVMESDSGLYRYAFAPLWTSMRNFDALVGGTPYLQGYSPLQLDRHRRLIEAMRPQVGAIATATSGIPLLDLANVKYIVTEEKLYHHPWIATRFDEGAKVYENKRVLPRAFMVPRAKIIADTQAILNYMTSPQFDPRSCVILEEAVSTLPWGNAPGDGTDWPRASVKLYQPNRIIVDVDSQGGYLVLTDTYYPGWQAYVDGEPVPILRADFYFRAVPITAGPHEVEFVYSPWTFKVGAFVSGVIVCFMLMGLLLLKK